MKKVWFITLGVLLCSCASVRSAGPTPSKPPPAGSASWALGERPLFSGTIVDWAKGDGIAPGKGDMYGKSYAVDPEGVTVGFGTVEPSGNFRFRLYSPDKAPVLGGGYPVERVLCGGLTRTNPKQKIVDVEGIEVPPLIVPDVHGRPPSAVLISVGKPPATQELYTFYWASENGRIRGSCTFEEGSFSFDLDLRKGWNSACYGGHLITTAPIPKEAKWYLFNPLTYR